jgi:hypothetical protein
MDQLDARLATSGAVIGILMFTGCGLIVPVPDRTEQVRVPWVLYGEAGNELELGVLTMGHDCQRFAGVDVVETAESVEIQAWVEQLPSDRCAMVLGIAQASATIGGSLGTRELIGCMIENSGSYSSRLDCAQFVDPETGSY